MSDPVWAFFCEAHPHAAAAEDWPRFVAQIRLAYPGDWTEATLREGLRVHDEEGNLKP